MRTLIRLALLFTAVMAIAAASRHREQLGLTLESATEALDAVVIDRIDRPTEN